MGVATMSPSSPPLSNPGSASALTLDGNQYAVCFYLTKWVKVFAVADQKAEDFLLRR